MRSFVGRFSALLIVLLAGIWAMGGLPIGAQEGQPVFATNTPVPATVSPSGLFQTATPAPSMTPVPVTETPAIRTPDGRIDQYALRLWLESDLLNVLIAYLNRLESDDEQSQRAVQLLDYELTRRFPGAPRQSAQREGLLEAMLAAPRGTVDMRTVVRPYIQDALNLQNPDILSDYNGFKIELFPANLDGIEPLDVIVHTRYPADALFATDVVYEGYILAVVDSAGFYRMLDSTPDFPAAPFDRVEAVLMEESGDLNGDSLDELAVAVHTGDVNQQLLIFGFRNGRFMNLVEPGQTLAFGELVGWSLNPPKVTVVQNRVESPAWQCVSQIEAEWAYQANFFRSVVVDPNRRYANQNSLACRLYEAEPLFAQPPAEAITTVEAILRQAGPNDGQAVQRAEMVLAMLYALDGRPSAAMDKASSLQSDAEPGSWLDRQASAFINTLNRAGATAIDLCAALMAASEYGACDIDQVLGRVFEDNPLVRSRPVLEQLQDRGLPVLESIMISSVGRADRLAVSFNLFGSSWWAFAPLSPEFYTAEQVEAPPGFESASAPVGFLNAPQSAYNALLVNDDQIAALAGIENVVRDNPGVPLSPSARYLQALSYDLAADRTRARNAYYTLWSEFPTTLWGQLAAVHLERR